MARDLQQPTGGSLSASAIEAAAIVAAVESFMRQTAPPGRGEQPLEHPSPWAQAAMLDGVRDYGDVDLANPWINT